MLRQAVVNFSFGECITASGFQNDLYISILVLLDNFRKVVKIVFLDFTLAKKMMCPIFVFFVSERRQGVSFVLHIQFTAHQLFLSMVPVYPCELVCNPYYLESIKIRFYVTIDNL